MLAGLLQKPASQPASLKLVLQVHEQELLGIDATPP